MTSDDDVRARLDAAIEQLDDAQRRRLLGWAGSMNERIDRAREPGASIGPIAEMMHIRNDLLEPGHAVYQLDVQPDLLNPHGVLHGGAIYTMVDYSMGGATMAALPAGEICTTIEVKISYLASVRGGALTADTRIVKHGRNVVFLESRVTDEAGRLVATATGSFMIIRAEER